jgi:hypothetical protein
MTITLEPLDPALEAYLLDLGKRAWNHGLTAAQYIERERLTLDYADAHVVHEGWKQARNLWQSNASYLFN